MKVIICLKMGKEYIEQNMYLQTTIHRTLLEEDVLPIL